MAAQYPEELTCDMAETYHVLDWRALGLPLAATLAAGLRENSRTRMALAGAKVPTETLLLGQAADALQLLLWTKPRTPSMAGTAPRPLCPPCWGGCRSVRRQALRTAPRMRLRGQGF